MNLNIYDQTPQTVFEYRQEFNITTRMIKSESMMGDEGFFYREFTFNQQAQLKFLKCPSLFFDRDGNCSSDYYHLLGKNSRKKGKQAARTQIMLKVSKCVWSLKEEKLHKSNDIKNNHFVYASIQKLTSLCDYGARGSMVSDISISQGCVISK